MATWMLRIQRLAQATLRGPKDWSDRINHERQRLSSLLCTVPGMTQCTANRGMLDELSNIISYANIGIIKRTLYRRRDALHVPAEEFRNGVLRHATTARILIIRDSERADMTPQLIACSEYFDTWFCCDSWHRSVR